MQILTNSLEFFYHFIVSFLSTFSHNTCCLRIQQACINQQVNLLTNQSRLLKHLSFLFYSKTFIHFIYSTCKDSLFSFFSEICIKLHKDQNNPESFHCLKRVACIWSYCGPYFYAFGLDTERYAYSVRIRETTDSQPT